MLSSKLFNWLLSPPGSLAENEFQASAAAWGTPTGRPAVESVLSVRARLGLVVELDALPLRRWVGEVPYASSRVAVRCHAARSCFSSTSSAASSSRSSKHLRSFSAISRSRSRV